MREQLNKPKRFGEILDVVFTLSRHRFMDFLKIFLIVVGPIYILEAIVQLSLGVSFFRELSTGANWFEQVVNSFMLGDDLDIQTTEGEFSTFVVSILGLLFVTIAQVSLIFAVNEIRNGEDFQLNEVIKRAFSRFWPLFRGGLVIGVGAVLALIIFGTISIFALTIVAVISEGMAVLFGILIFLAFFAGFAFFAAKFSMYIAAIAFGDKAFQSLGRSWRLTRGRVWSLIGIYLVFLIIIGIINSIFESIFALGLGNSVLFGLLTNGVLLVTTMLASVGYAVVYFDLFARHDSADLKEMIADYDVKNE